MKYQFQPFLHNPDAEWTVSRKHLAIPELSDGFDPSQLSLAGGMADAMVPVSYYTGEVPQGTYEIHIALTALRDVEQLFLFTGRKLLRDIVSLKKGDRYERTFFQSVAGIIPRYHEEYYPVRNLFFTFCTAEADAVRVDECYGAPVHGLTSVFLCGDSTVTDQSAEIPYHPGACYASWGQALPAYLDGKIAVENQAHCGLTTETFRQEGHMDIVKRLIRPGDFCLFQFGHNDQKLPHLLAHREYPVNLKRYVEEVRELGGIPVLVTSLGRNIWNPDGTYRELLAEHVKAVKDTARATDTAYIDLHKFSVDFFLKHGMEQSCGYFHPGDYTHTNDYGACLFASCIAEGLGRLYPDVFHTVPGPVDFIPPENLWDTLSQQNNRAGGAEQKEQFDTMEKSTAALLKALEEVNQSAL